MLKPSPILFSEIRNLKRTHTGLNSVKEMPGGSSKQIKKTRSTKHIDITSYMDTKNQKIKNIDEKLQVHQSEIHKNSQFIEELNQNFFNLREHLVKEKENTLNQERKNKLLRDQIERTNKILKSKNTKIQELVKKVAELQKENQNLKPFLAKTEEYVKTISSLRGKISIAEEQITQLKQTVSEKQKDIQRQKQRMSSFEAIKAKQEDSDNQILMKDEQIRSLKQSIQEIYTQKDRALAYKYATERKMDALVAQIQNLNEVQSTLSSKAQGMQKKFNDNKAKFQKLQSEYKQRQLRLREREQNESNTKQQLTQVKSKLTVLQNEVSQKSKLLEKKDAKIEKQAQKIKDLQNIIGEAYKQKDKLKSLQDKVGLLKQKANSLQTVYSSIIPQIQCPFGHELHNPVTIIPCGHNYCLGCKKGYLKDCMLCNGKLKIEAVYRNELMDDIIGIVGGIRSVIEILK